MGKIIIEQAEKQENLLIACRDSLLKRNKNYNDNRSYEYERAKLIGMIDIMDSLKIDRSKFNWIYL